MGITISASFKRMLHSLHDDSKIAEAVLDHHATVYVISDEINYLTMRNGMMSYLPNGKEHLTNDDGTWRRENRQEGKPARVIRKVISEKLSNHFGLTDSDYEKFSNMVASYCHVNGDDDRPPTIAIVVANGDLIHEFYNGTSSDAGGNLSGSCMRGKDVFDMYTFNDHKVNMVCAINEVHQVVGRALLWLGDDGFRYMDTIYAADHLRELFISFAKENGIYYKSEQSCHYHEFDKLNGRSVPSRNVRVTLNDWDYGEYPYMDTMRYLDTDNCVLSNYEPSGDYYLLRCTDGGYEDCSPYEEDVYDGGRVHRDNATHIDYERPSGRWICGYTDSSNVTEVVGGWYALDEDCVEVDGSWYVMNSDDIVELPNGTYVMADSVITDFRGDYIENDYAVKAMVCVVGMTYQDWVHIDECTMINDSWYHKSLVVTCTDTGKMYIAGHSSDVK